MSHYTLCLTIGTLTLPQIKTADSALTGNGASVTRPSSDFSGRSLGTRLTPSSGSVFNEIHCHSPHVHFRILQCCVSAFLVITEFISILLKISACDRLPHPPDLHKVRDRCIVRTRPLEEWCLCCVSRKQGILPSSWSPYCWLQLCTAFTTAVS